MGAASSCVQGEGSKEAKDASAAEQNQGQGGGQRFMFKAVESAKLEAYAGKNNRLKLTRG